jgi:hypothetical protein
MWHHAVPRPTSSRGVSKFPANSCPVGCCRWLRLLYIVESWFSTIFTDRSNLPISVVLNGRGFYRSEVFFDISTWYRLCGNRFAINQSINPRTSPYRKSMDPGCGSATVLIPLQVLLSSCYGRKALIRSNTVYFWILDNLNSLIVTNTMRLEITW